MFELIIRNGTILTGDGSKGFIGDIAINHGKIAEIAPHIKETGRKELDASDCYVTPGFIDIHRHADAALFQPNFGEVELRQGLTTIVNGNCGLSIVPCPQPYRNEILDFLLPVTGKVPNEIYFDDFPSYIKAVSSTPLPLNIGMLIGNGTVRAAVKGYATGKLTKEELNKAKSFLHSSLEAGALGVSLGIVYAPEYNYNVKDFVEVLEPMKEYHVPLVTHIRGEGDIFCESIEEVISIAKQLHVPLHISHLKCIGKNNWGHKTEQVLTLINHARESGLEITCDLYPYTAGSTQLIQILPPEYLEGGFPAITKRLKNPAERKKLTAILKEPSSAFENLVAGIEWENIILSTIHSEKNKCFIGKSIAETAKILNKDVYECAYDLLIEEKCRISMVDFIVLEDDIRKIMKYPYTSIISDTVYPDGGIYHPRMYGTYAKYIGQYIRDEKLIPMEEAIRKITSLPASLYHLSTKGLLKKNMDADINVFQLQHIRTDATYQNPQSMSKGFRYVIVNGQICVENDSCRKHLDFGRLLLRS